MTVGLTFAAVALVAALATPVWAAVALRIGLVVDPRADRWHGRRTPLLGGAAMALAVLLAMALGLPETTRGVVIVLCAGAAFALGLLDDFRGLAPATKVAGQVLIASALVVGGARVEIVQSTPVAYLISVLWIVVIMNAVNLMDNMDGLAAGISAIGAAVLAATAGPRDPLAIFLAMATAGAALGFLVHNFPPARVFMGDAGSQLLGFLLAATALVHTSTGAANLGLAVLAPLAALALPIFDTTLVAAARRLAGVPIGRGGRDHTSHRLASLGLSDRSVALLLYAVALVFGLLGVAIDLVAGVAIPIFVLALICLVLFGVFLVDTAAGGYRREEPPFGRAFAAYGRFGAEIVLDVVLLTTVYYLSYVIRFEVQPSTAWDDLLLQSLPIVVGAQIASFVVFGVYRTLWRYIGIGDAALIVRSLSAGSAAAVIALVMATRFEGYSRAVFAIDWLLACVVIIGSRSFLLWLMHEFAARPKADARRVLIVGANESGMFALRLLGRSGREPYRVVGFLDDDPGKRYRRLGGVRVVGSTADVPEILGRHVADVVVLAVEAADAAARERVRAACAAAGVECRDLLMTV